MTIFKSVCKLITNTCEQGKELEEAMAGSLCQKRGLAKIYSEVLMTAKQKCFSI